MSKVKSAIRNGVLCLVAMSTLSGCTVPFGSVLGLTVNDDGEVLAVAAVCSGYLDSVSVTSTDFETIDLTRDFATRVDDVGTVSLTNSDGVQPGVALSPNDVRLLRGDTLDASWQAVGPRFTQQDLDALEVNRVWFNGWDQQEQTTAYRSVAIKDFRTESCADMEALRRAP